MGTLTRLNPGKFVQQSIDVNVDVALACRSRCKGVQAVMQLVVLGQIFSPANVSGPACIAECFDMLYLEIDHCFAIAAQTQ